MKKFGVIIAGIGGIAGLVWLGSGLWNNRLGGTDLTRIGFVTQQVGFDCKKIIDIDIKVCESLVDLYKKTNGNSRINKEGRLTSYTPCGDNKGNGKWFGVSCEGSIVKYLSLYGNNLQGPLPDLYLPHTRGLYLGNNYLVGDIPNFSNMGSMGQLELQKNKLTSLPNFSNMPNLYWINVSDNDITQSIPNFSGSPKLYYIKISNNKFNGSIPDFPHFRNVGSNFYAENNQLCDILPDGFKEFEKKNIWGYVWLKNNHIINLESYYKPDHEDVYNRAYNSRGAIGFDEQTPQECGSKAPQCGNSNIELGEQCDDGNTIDDDECNNTCHKNGINCNKVNFTITPESAEPGISRIATWNNPGGNMHYFGIQRKAGNGTMVPSITKTPSPTTYDQMYEPGEYEIKLMFTDQQGFGVTSSCKKKIIVQKPIRYSCNKSSYSCEVDENGIYGMINNGLGECNERCKVNTWCNTNAVKKKTKDCPYNENCDDGVYGDDVTKHPSYYKLCRYQDMQTNSSWDGPPNSVIFDPINNQWIVSCTGRGGNWGQDGTSNLKCDMTIKKFYCGDKIKNGSEQCDDGNINEYDGCNKKCVITSIKKTYEENYNYTNKDDGNNEVITVIGGSIPTNTIVNTDYPGVYPKEDYNGRIITTDTSDYEINSSTTYNQNYPYYMPKIYNTYPSSLYKTSLPIKEVKKTSLTILKQ